MAEQPPLLRLLALQPELVTDALIDDVTALARLARTCRDAHRIVMGDRVWRKLCVRRAVLLPQGGFSGAFVTDASEVASGAPAI